LITEKLPQKSAVNLALVKLLPEMAGTVRRYEQQIAEAPEIP